MKKRIIPSILLERGSTNVCLSQRFSPWRTVGTLAQQLKLHVTRHCDELLIINPFPSVNSTLPLSLRLSKLISTNTDIPIAYAGGVLNQFIASECINKCFDKVYLTTSFLDDFSVLSDISNVVGVQSVGICLPYCYVQELGNRYVFDFKNQKCLTSHPLEYFIRIAVANGAGEIFLFSVDRDGTLSGLDVEIFPLLASCQLTIPVLIGGGAGNPEHIANILKSDLVQGVVVSSIFALTEQTPSTLRDYCMSRGIPMRKV